MTGTKHREYIDLRSDTVTRPTPAMRRAMSEADVGDDVFGDDPTVIRLQQTAADMLQTEAALFLPSGTQSNLCALLSHCQRGDEYIVGQTAHTYRMEAGGAAVMGSIQPQPLNFEPDGTLDLDLVAANIKPDDPHFAISRLLCLENTQNGKVLPMDYLANARRFDSVSVCLSKGLCAPVGSVLCGSREFIRTAHRWRKMLGGGMRQAGVLASAGILALMEQVDHLKRDHMNAAVLAEHLGSIDELEIRYDGNQTNMIFAAVKTGLLPTLMKEMKTRGVLIHGFGDTMRLVTHHDFKADQIDLVVDAFKDFFQAPQQSAAG